MKRFFFFFILLIFSLHAHSQTNGNGEHDEQYLSAYTEDRDTLYLVDDSTGHLIKSAWDKSDTVERPEIIFVRARDIKLLGERRKDVIIPKN